MNVNIVKKIIRESISYTTCAIEGSPYDESDLENQVKELQKLYAFLNKDVEIVENELNEIISINLK